MTKTHVRRSIAALLVFGFAASGCAVDTEESPAAGESAAVGVKVAIPSQEIFEYAPEGEQIETVKAVQEDSLLAKGSYTVRYGETYTQAVTLTNGQTVNFSTSGGSIGVDPVLVLFRRNDNRTGFAEAPYTQQVGLTTLAINDDSGPGTLHSAISYTNTSGHTENARLMVFAWSSNTGTVDINGIGPITVAAGSVRDVGLAGMAWTSDSTGLADPWLFTFNATAGGNDGNWQDDTSTNPRNLDSTITGNTNLEMWYVAHGWVSGITTINN
jgi:hypothetical protein